MTAPIRIADVSGFHGDRYSAMREMLAGGDRQEDFRRMAAVSAERFGSAEAREGIAALLEKRPAAWAAGA